MSYFRHHPHALKAVIGIVPGIILAIAAAILCYFTYVPGKGTRWALLILPALPLVAWGCLHLAQHRGYPSAAGCGLFILGLFVSGLIAGTKSTLTIGFAFVFVTLLPTIVLLVLPRKSEHHHRR